jgi:hypothetical protein
VLVLARLCEPSRELHIAETWYRGTALEDLFALPAPLVNDDRLYRALDRQQCEKRDADVVACVIRNAGPQPATSGFLRLHLDSRICICWSTALRHLVVCH